MSAKDILTAYSIAIPRKQSQDQPGLDKNIDPGVEYIAQEVWDNEGKPHLRDYVGSGKLQGKYILLTGADSGIGRAAAIMFAREGAAGITFSYLPEEEEDAKHAANTMKKDGKNIDVLPIALNLQHEDSCRKLVESHIKKFGALNVLVNNAGKQMIAQQLADINLENVRSTFESNILQFFAVTKFALPHMKRGSAIINTTSVVAYAGAPNLIDYSSTKGAILTFTRSLALQLAPKGIRVNAVAPGPVMTALQPASRDADEMEEFGVGMPLHGRAAQPAELGPAYVFLASADSNCMTGAVIHINNGMHVGGS